MRHSLIAIVAAIHKEEMVTIVQNNEYIRRVYRQNTMPLKASLVMYIEEKNKEEETFQREDACSYLHYAIVSSY